MKIEDKPLIIQSDATLLLEVNHPSFEQVRNQLSYFADLLKSPEHMHTYRITPMSLWNAASAGIDGERILSTLRQFSKFDIPMNVYKDIVHFTERYGLLCLEEGEDGLHLYSTDSHIIDEIQSFASLKTFNLIPLNANTLMLDPSYRGLLKQELIRLGYPVEDHVGYHQGEALHIELSSNSNVDRSFCLRDYQHAAVEAFHQDGGAHGGSGVLVLPCGAGKTIIGIAAMARLGCETLILTSNVTSIRQWKREILEKTTITEQSIGEYTGKSKVVRPITIATYQILTHRKNKASDFLHMKLFKERDWGLIIYDEVHLLPAPVFRMTAEIQATRRLGLTATLIREDRREEDVFSLVGPKRFDAHWKDMEQKGWIARVKCTEIRVPLSVQLEAQYMLAESKHKHRLAGENPIKIQVVKYILSNHKDVPTIIIGQYLDQLQEISETLGVPFISGKMPHLERERLYNQFIRGEKNILIVSKVANFAVDLPDAAVAIQVSGSFGSRQEEAQRLGRILRPKQKKNEAHFYTLVSKNTKEQEFSMNRQLFLVEQGYHYDIKDAETLLNRSGCR